MKDANVNRNAILIIFFFKSLDKFQFYKQFLSLLVIFAEKVEQNSYFSISKNIWEFAFIIFVDMIFTN